MSYAPDESEYDLFFERTFMSSGFLAGVGYGVQFALYCACMRLLWKQRKTKTRSTLLMIYISVLFCLNTLYARNLELSYIDDRNYPGGPLQFFLDTFYIPINVLASVVFFIANVMADALLFYRCKVIWSAFAHGVYLCGVLTLPFLLLLASFTMGLLWTIQSCSPGFSVYSGVSVAFGLPYFSISLALNIMLTGLIAIRLLLHRRETIAVLGEIHGRPYITLASITVESAALYSVFLLIFLITYAINNPINQIFLGLLTPIQLIATYLIIYRVADGKAWSKDTSSNPSGIEIDFPDASTPTTSCTASSEPKFITTTESSSSDLSQSNGVAFLNVTKSLEKDKFGNSDCGIGPILNV